MVTFNQEGQTVHGDQYNAKSMTFNIGKIENKVDFARELKSFNRLLDKAIAEKFIDAEAAIDVDANIKKTFIQVGSETPNKSKIVDYLSNIKSVVKPVTGLLEAIGRLITAANGIFS